MEKRGGVGEQDRKGDLLSGMGRTFTKTTEIAFMPHGKCFGNPDLGDTEVSGCVLVRIQRLLNDRASVSNLWDWVMSGHRILSVFSSNTL